MAKPKKIDRILEESKRGAAGTAKTTQGRARIFRDRTKYDRKQDKEAKPDEN